MERGGAMGVLIDLVVVVVVVVVVVGSVERRECWKISLIER